MLQKLLNCRGSNKLYKWLSPIPFEIIWKRFIALIGLLSMLILSLSFLICCFCNHKDVKTSTIEKDVVVREISEEGLFIKTIKIKVEPYYRNYNHDIEYEYYNIPKDMSLLFHNTLYSGDRITLRIEKYMFTSIHYECEKCNGIVQWAMSPPMTNDDLIID